MMRLMLCTLTTTSQSGVLDLSTPKVSGAAGWGGRGLPAGTHHPPSHTHAQDTLTGRSSDFGHHVMSCQACLLAILPGKRAVLSGTAAQDPCRRCSQAHVLAVIVTATRFAQMF